MLLGSFAPLAMGQASVQGQWSTLPYTMTINPIHAGLLHNNKILVVTGSGNCPPTQAGCPTGPPYGPANGSGAVLLDLVAGTITPFSVTFDMFCNGMTILPDGRAFINGGTINYVPFSGSSQSAIFDPATNIFTYLQNMAHGRWYPTVITLGTGQVMTFSGFDENGEITNTAVEIYTVNSGWSQQYIANWTPPLYPRLHLLPSGNVFYSGETNATQMFDPLNQTWTPVANTVYGITRTYGSSVLLPLTPANNYDPRVFIMGGGNPGTDTTELIDLGAAKPAWVAGPNMSEPRIEMNATLLPNGKVLALGGSLNDEDTTTASYNADLYDPATNTFSSAGANAYPRLYHSVSLLLPDGTVWFTGGNPERGSYEDHMEIYQPAYLFNSDGTLATRPTISSAPSSISYGTPFTVQTPDAASIASVVLMKDGSVTHAFDMDQRQVGMSFTVGNGALTVTAPPNSNIAPAGYYMLFLLNSSGVPSVATFVQLSASAPPTSPGINFVQATTGPSTIQAANTSVSVAYINTQNAGDLNIVAVGWEDTTSAIGSVTDTHGNTYTRAVAPIPSGGLQQAIYYAKNIAAGGNTVTVTFNQAAAYPDVRILEYSGLDPTSPLDVTAAAAGSGASASSGGATTTSANELIFGSGTTTGTAFTAPGSGFTTRVLDIYGNLAEDMTVSSPGSNAATATNSSGNWVMQMATFKASAPGDFSISTSPSSATVSAGGSVNDSISVSGLNGFSSPVTLACSGLPSGASCTFNPASVSPNSNPATSTLTISAASGTAANTYNVTITGTSGSLSHNASVSLTVATAVEFSISVTSPVTVAAGSSVATTVSITPANGFNAAVSLACSAGLPAGAACSFSPASMGSGNSTLNITTTSTTPVGTYPITVTGTSGSLTNPATVTLTVTAGGGSFSLSTPTPASATVTAGGSATFTTTVSPTGGFGGTVTLSCVIATSASPAPACSSANVTVNGAAVQTTLTVTTTAPHTSRAPSSRIFYALLLPLGGMTLLGASGVSRRRKVLSLLLMFLAASGLLFLTACGGGTSSSGAPGGGGTTGGTPAGTYTVTVTGTSGSLTAQTTMFTITVQ
jgi:hypothetical protein